MCYIDQVIGRASDHRRLLLAIKAEYDDVIRELKRGRGHKAATSPQTSLGTCQRRASQLRDR